MRIAIIGAGGQGREVLDILRAADIADENHCIAGFIDDNRAIHGQIIDGLPVVGDWAWFEEQNLAELRVICAVGSPAAAYKLVQRAQQIGLDFASAVSPASIISPLAKMGKGLVIFPNAVIGPGAIVNDFAIVNVASTISHDSNIGEFVNINPGAHIAGNVTVGTGAYIGMGSSIIQNRRIGAWSTIGAGAAVISDIPDHVTAVGVPARVVIRHKKDLC
ncbi:MAG: acetyltransferase [Caldilineaceae bacterium]